MPIILRFLIILSIFISGCLQTYKQDIYQGSEISKEQLKKIKIGMSKTQVKNILGSPAIIDIFHKYRWDYITYIRVNNAYKKSNLTLLFNKNNQLKKIN